MHLEPSPGRHLRPTALLGAVVGLTALSADAALVVTNMDSATELAFAGDVSNSDLINGNAGTVPAGSDAFTLGGAAVLTDGSHGAAGVSTGDIAWDQTNAGNTRIDYNLGLGGGFGHDLTLIRTVATWQSANFEDQRYNVYVATVANPTFTLLNPAPIENLTARDAGTTKTELTDTTGTLATGVTDIRFEILPIVSSVPGNTNGTTFREFDVEGFQTVIPEPSQLAFVGLALGLLAFRRRR